MIKKKIIAIILGITLFLYSITIFLLFWSFGFIILIGKFKFYRELVFNFMGYFFYAGVTTFIISGLIISLDYYRKAWPDVLKERLWSRIFSSEFNLLPYVKFITNFSFIGFVAYGLMMVKDNLLPHLKLEKSFKFFYKQQILDNLCYIHSISSYIFIIIFMFFFFASFMLSSPRLNLTPSKTVTWGLILSGLLCLPLLMLATLFQLIITIDIVSREWQPSFEPPLEKYFAPKKERLFNLLPIMVEYLNFEAYYYEVLREEL